MENNLLSVADAIEGLCCLEIRPPGGSQGVVRPLAAMARERQGGPPVLIAAQRLVERVRPGDLVVIATGFYTDAMPHGESDGPPGAASLAYALSRGLGAVPLVLAEQQCLAPTRASLRAIGLAEWPLDEVLGKPRAFALQTFPTDGRAEGRADELLQMLRPSAILVVEKPGLNAKGVAHRGGGKAIADGRMRAEVLTAKARDAGVLTIAIGDNGNEVGMGLVAEATRKYKDWGAVCQCPCQGGIAAVDEVDVTVIASVSNLGAYGIAAMLGVLLGSDATIHDADAERRMIEDCQRAGAVDGILLGPSFSVDGIPGRFFCHAVDTLGIIVRTALGRESP